MLKDRVFVSASGLLVGRGGGVEVIEFFGYVLWWWWWLFFFSHIRHGTVPDFDEVQFLWKIL